MVNPWSQPHFCIYSRESANQKMGGGEGFGCQTTSCMRYALIVGDLPILPLPPSQKSEKPSIHFLQISKYHEVGNCLACPVKSLPSKTKLPSTLLPTKHSGPNPEYRLNTLNQSIPKEPSFEKSKSWQLPGTLLVGVQCSWTIGNYY